MRKVAGILVLMMVATLLPVSVSAAAVMSADEVAAREERVWLDEDFSTDTNGWTVEAEGASIDTQLGILKAVPVEGTSNRIMGEYTGLKDLPIGDTWSVRFKHKGISGDDFQGIVRTDTHRFLWIIKPVEREFRTNGGYSPVYYFDTFPDQWYEYQYSFTMVDGKQYGSIHRRAVGTAAWQTVREMHEMKDASSDKWIMFSARLNGEAQVDDVQVYQGTYRKFDEPSLVGTTLVTGGIFDNAEPGETKARQVNMIAAVYDGEHGYTKEVLVKPYLVEPGTTADLTHNFAFSKYNPEKKDSYILAYWDGVDNGVSLGAAKGAVFTDTSETRPAAGQEVGVVADVKYNEVILNGYLGKSNATMTATLMKDGTVYAITEAKANDYGMISTKLGVDPETCTSGAYTLRVQYGKTAATTTEIPMVVCNDKIPAEKINSEADLQSFLTNYGSKEDKEIIADPAVMTRVYKYFSRIATDESYDDVYSLQETLQAAVQLGNDENVLVEKLNLAVANDNWAEMETMLMTTYRDMVGIEEGALAGIKDTKEVFLLMEGGYTCAEDILTSFTKAANTRRTIEAQTGSYTGVVTTPAVGGFGGGGYGGNKNFSVVPDPEKEAATKPVQPIDQKAEFKDLASVPWAEESIKSLQGLGIIDGDGDGNFDPDRAVSREEFLKLAMSAAGMDTKGANALEFADVQADAWYSPYVASAFEKGIIKGVNEQEFGVGREITRADMAVILKRILDYCGIEVKGVRPAFRFDDGLMIPIYALDDVSALCEAGLLQGVGDNNFMPMNSATRAEAAVAIHKIYKYIQEGR